ncbi:SH2 domain-containing adapter protein B-like isoform X2 [Asterias rubens]|uniref:SH2 domain-containing adapter protein B-like isoform X2 n=1 Tax=Asterias rubens TaxID=7604 RepID=UPI00145518D9|nr:SH2 domain-containing adapter protein B-like isoform X2 [Asterias rubens]
MAKLLRMFQGKKAPHPPKRDYTDKQGERRTKTSMSDSEDESAGGGVFSASNDSSPRGNSPTPPPNPSHGHGADRFRFGSQTSYGTGTVDLKSCGGGSSGGHMGTNSRGTMGGIGEGGLTERRRNDSGSGPKSPNTKQPVVLDDYSDPKDVLKSSVDGGPLPMGPEGPLSNQPYAEDDYSVPYGVIKQLRSGTLPEDGPMPDQPYADDDYSLPYDLVKKNRHQIPEEGWDPNRMTIPEDDYSLPYDVLKKIQTQAKGQSSTKFKPTSIRQQQHQYEEPPDVSELHRRVSEDESPDDQPGLENSRKQDAPVAMDNAEENGNLSSSDAPLSPQPDQTPQNDMRPQGEYDNPWEWRSHQLPRLPPESPGGEFKRSRKREKQNIVSRSGASTPDNARKQSPMKKPSKELKLELSKHSKHDVQGEKIDPNLSLDAQTFYHGKLSRTEAEKLLKPCKECSYLVRQSESAQKDYSLSLKSAKGFMHMKIVSHPQGYILGEFSKPFLGIPQMIFYYTTHKLNIRGAEHMALLHPVDNQLL